MPQLSGSAKRKIVSDRQKLSQGKGIDPSAVGDFRACQVRQWRLGTFGAWVNDAMLIAFDQVIRDATLTNIERWQWMERLGKRLGCCETKQPSSRRSKGAQRNGHRGPKPGTVSANGRTRKRFRAHLEDQQAREGRVFC